MKHTLLFVFGTRPEAIKMAPVILEVKKNADFDVQICITGQHRQMLDQVMSLFEIDADFDLDIMKPGQTLSTITSTILEGLDSVIQKVNPDCILVHGDTTTTMAASLSAYYSKIPLAHIEAGLRTSDIFSPWPEEMNRRLTGIVSSLHFCPTETSKINLINEKILEHNIFVTGNTVIDALLNTVKKLDTDRDLKETIESKFDFLDNSKKLLLVTGHRRESFGDGFNQICSALEKLSKRNDIQIVYPVHLNPNVQEPVNKVLGKCKNVHLIQPQDYLPFVYLMNRAYLILTDSGGVQEEAPSLGTPVLVMRDKTERPEGIDAGTVKLVGTNSRDIIGSVTQLFDNELTYQKMSSVENPYGNGTASIQISSALSQFFARRTEAA